ncbi:MAG: glycosyltransferase [Candidatus Aquirickettsiella sp.]
MKQFIRKQLVRLISKFVKMTYMRRLILLVYRLYSKEITGSHETVLDNYGHAIQGLEKALHRHETSLNHLQNQLQQFMADNTHLKKQIEAVNSETFSENKSSLQHSSLTPNTALKVSLIINTYNRLHTLPNTLNSLNYLRYPHLEVIVVDGPSTDGTLHYLQTVWASKVKISTCNLANLAKSRNIGIMQAAGDIVCFIDDDAVPEADWLDELVSAYQDNKVAAVGGWTRDHTGVDFQTRHVLYTRTSVSEGVDISDPLQIQSYNTHAEKFPGLAGVNSSFRRSALLEIGGFDEEYAYLAEEADVVLRLLDAGYEIRTVPTAEVHHYSASNHIRSQRDNICSWSQTMTSIAYFCIKNAAPATSFRRCLEQIEERKDDLRSNTRYRLARNRIDRANFERLMAEIDQFSRQGITDAFTFPCRQLMKNDISQPPQWQTFPRLLAVPRCLRLAFILEDYPPSACDKVTLSIYHLAQGLATAGHEITVITQTETNQHTVSFETNLWVHRLPKDTSIAATFPQGIPTGIPDAFRHTAGRILAELDRIKERRQIDYVIGSNWNLSLAAIIASRQYPVILYLCLQDTVAWQEKILGYQKYVTQLTYARVQILQQAKHILACSQTVCRDIELSLGICLDEKRITLFTEDDCHSAMQKLESILYDLQGELRSQPLNSLPIAAEMKQ